VHSRFGREQSGGEIVQAEAGIVYRLLERRRAEAKYGFTGGQWIKGEQGRHKACPCRSVWGEHCWLDTLLGKNEHGGLERAERQGSGVRG